MLNLSRLSAKVECLFTFFLKSTSSSKLPIVDLGFYSDLVSRKQGTQLLWIVCVQLLVAEPCPTLCNPMGCSPPGSSVHGILQATIMESCHALLQGIFLTQGSNLGLLHCRQILYHLSHQ